MNRVQPAARQESVWDYPRPPRWEEVTKRLQVVFNGVMIAETRRAKRVLETSHPPTYYIPLEDVRAEFLIPTRHTSFCEWKGLASYYSVKVGNKEAQNAAWYYPDPMPSFASIKNAVAFYPSKMEACFVEEERVQAQSSDFYGGWITAEIVGPFKGEPGTEGW